MRIIFNDTLGAYGGSHTLMARMCRWLNKNGYESTIICDRATNVEIVETLKDNGTDIVVCKSSKTKQLHDYVKTIKEDFVFINFAWNQYLDIEVLKHKYKLVFDNLIYSIHPATFEKGSGFKTKLMRSISKNKYRKNFLKMNENNSIIMMDEQNTYYALDYLKIKRSEIDVPIVRLSMEIDDASTEYIKKGYASNVVLTSSRADFPYKGYLMGLVDSFPSLVKKIPDIELVIVAAGDDMGLLNKKIEELDVNVKNKIKTIGWVKYDELKSMLCECKLYVGLGSSVFDSSLRYKPSIAVMCDTYDILANNYFCYEPNYINALEGTREKYEELVCRVFNMNYDQYEKIALFSRKSIIDNYDINTNMPKLISRRTNNQKCILSKCQIVVHRLNCFLNSIRYRHPKNDFENLNK